jgi:ATP-dependent Clp protease ATP-binding subunit ClpB
MGALIEPYKGEFEERLKSVVKEVTAAEGDIVLFIDEISRSLVLAVEGAMDAANILQLWLVENCALLVQHLR